MIQKSDFLKEDENKVKYFQNGVEIGELTMVEALQLEIYIFENKIEDVTYLDDKDNKIYKMLPNGTHENHPPLAFTQFNRLLGKFIKIMHNLV